MKHQENESESVRQSDHQTEPSTTRDSDQDSGPGDSGGELGASAEDPDAQPPDSGNGRSRPVPASAGYFNVVLPTGKIQSRYYPNGRPTILGEGEHLTKGGPYPSFRIAMSRSRSDLFYPYLLKQALKRGIFTLEGRRYPEQLEVAGWCDYGIEALQAWTRPITSVSRRKMPRRAIRLIIHEFKLRDKSKYDWDLVLRYCD